MSGTQQSTVSQAAMFYYVCMQTTLCIKPHTQSGSDETLRRRTAVSYTHLDVYKRQGLHTSFEYLPPPSEAFG